MAPSFMKKKSSNIATAVAVADAISFYGTLLIVVLVLISSLRDTRPATAVAAAAETEQYSIASTTVKGKQLISRPCEEIYVVGEGETLHTISDKCGDPFIVERNPHIHDPDDVFPGLVIKLNPSKQSMH